MSPVDRLANLVPLSVVVFNQATSIPGTPVMMTSVEAMAARLVAGEHFSCPQPYLDLENRLVVIGARVYPLERVHYMERAKAAKSVPDPAPDYTRYTVGPGVFRRTTKP